MRAVAAARAEESAGVSACLYYLSQAIRMLSTFSKWCWTNSDMNENPFSTATEKGLKREDKIKVFTDEEICRIFDPSVFQVQQ